MWFETAGALLSCGIWYKYGMFQSQVGSSLKSLLKISVFSEDFPAQLILQTREICAGVQISFQTFWFLTEGTTKNFSNFPTIAAYGQVLYSHRNWFNRKGIHMDQKKTTNNSNFRWWHMHHGRRLWWPRNYRMSMVIMRAIRFKCIYNTISGSREPKVYSKNDNEVLPSEALKPQRRWPLSPVCTRGLGCVWALQAVGQSSLFWVRLK